MAGRLELGIHVMTYGATWPEVASLAQEVDRLGFDFLLCTITCSRPRATSISGSTSRIRRWRAWPCITSRVRLGHLTVGNPFRNPGVVAKATATLDHISNGRMTLCLGAGSLPSEFTHGLAVGQTLGDRLQALDESLSIVTRILAGEEVTFDSANYHFDRVKHRPRPLQPHIPVIVGATGEKVGLRIAATYADYWQMSIEPGSAGQFVHKAEVLASHSEAIGRDPLTIKRMPEDLGRPARDAGTGDGRVRGVRGSLRVDR